MNLFRVSDAPGDVAKSGDIPCFIIEELVGRDAPVLAGCTRTEISRVDLQLVLRLSGLYQSQTDEMNLQICSLEVV